MLDKDALKIFGRALQKTMPPLAHEPLPQDLHLLVQRLRRREASVTPQEQRARAA